MHQAIRLDSVMMRLKLLNCGLSGLHPFLPPAVFEELADLFNCPVIEAYGMTEVHIK